MSGELIDVAIKSDEYCFLWIDWWVSCLTKNEWATWSQLAGTLLAIYITYLVSSKESRRLKSIRNKEGIIWLAQNLTEIETLRAKIASISAGVEKLEFNEKYEIDALVKTFEQIKIPSIEILVY